MAIPNISVRHPRPDDIVDDPVEVAGVGTGFEGSLVARLRNATGQEIAKRPFQAGGTGIWGSFFFRIDVPGIPNRSRGTLEIFEVSARDGSEIHKRVVPILFGRALQTRTTALPSTRSSGERRCRLSRKSSTAIRTASEPSSRPTA